MNRDKSLYIFDIESCDGGVRYLTQFPLQSSVFVKYLKWRNTVLLTIYSSDLYLVLSHTVSTCAFCYALHWIMFYL